MNSGYRYLMTLFVFLAWCMMAQGQVDDGAAYSEEGGDDLAEESAAAAPSMRDREVKRYRYQDSIQVYKIIDYYGDTTLVDTSLYIDKLYRLNQRRKDHFGMMPYPNMGQGFTPMVFNQEVTLIPQLGVRSRDDFYRKTQDIEYYDVRTPFSEVMFLTNLFGEAKGQILDFKFSANLNPLTNISVGYRGTRTFGTFAYSASAFGQVVATLSTRTRNYRYWVRSHFTYQFLSETENGGITPEGLEYFETGDPDFNLSSSLPTNLSTTGEEVVNRLGGTRFFIQQNYDIFNSSILDPKKFRVSLVNEITWQQKNYKYMDPAFASSAGEAAQKSFQFYNSGLVNLPSKVDSAYYRTTSVSLGVGVNIPLVNLYAQGGVRYDNTMYKLPSETVLDGVYSPGKVNGSTIGVDALARWNPIKYAGADARFQWNFAGQWRDARLLKIGGFGQLNEKNRIEGYYANYSYYAPMISQLYHSNFALFNWNNNFSRIERNEVKIQLKSKYIDAGFNLTNLSDYVYYDADRLPRQWDGKVNIMGIYAGKNLVFRHFGVDASLILQKTVNGSAIVPLPEMIGRASVYYRGRLFRRALELMVGATANYYSEFYAPYYNPLISDYNVQAAEGGRKVGGYPFIDLFLAAKVRRTRIFLRYENANSWLSVYNSWSGPNQPYNSAILKFGIVWDWFN